MEKLKEIATTIFYLMAAVGMCLMAARATTGTSPGESFNRCDLPEFEASENCN